MTTNNMKTIIYQVFIGNKWTSTLIIFSILVVLMIFWTIQVEGISSWNLTDPNEFILRMILPIVLSMLYLLYRFINEGRLKRASISVNENISEGAEAKKSLFQLIAQVVILDVIAALAAFIFYYYLLFTLFFSGPKVVFTILSVPILIFWFYKTVDVIKQAYNRGIDIPLSKKLFLMFLAFLSCYSLIMTYNYVNYKIYEREIDARQAQALAEVAEENQRLDRTSQINQPTIVTEKTFYSPVYGDTP